MLHSMNNLQLERIECKEIEVLTNHLNSLQSKILSNAQKHPAILQTHTLDTNSDAFDRVSVRFSFPIKSFRCVQFLIESNVLIGFRLNCCIYCNHFVGFAHKFSYIVTIHLHLFTFGILLDWAFSDAKSFPFSVD